MKEKRKWGNANPDRYCEVRYEHLVVNPESEIRRICEFIGIEFRPEMLTFYQGEMAQTIARSTTHVLLGSPIESGNREKWRTRMCEEDVASFEWIAGDVLTAAGYPTTDTKLSRIKKLRFAGCDMLSRLKSFFSYRALRLSLKGTLPFILLIADFVGININTLINSRI